MANTAVVYGRKYGERELRFEPSGGLIHYSLVMQDKETDSYWSIMTGEALAGEFRGTPLVELPHGEKVQWQDWVRAHPDTLVLSVNGVEHEATNPYEGYLSSPEGFRGSRAADERLPTKAPVYAFRLDGRPYAVPFTAIEGGASFRVGGRRAFFYRPEDAAIFDSTVALVATEGRFLRRAGSWYHVPSGARFDPRTTRFGDAGESGLAPLDGFDTFWFNWSMTQPDTRLLSRR